MALATRFSSDSHSAIMALFATLPSSSLVVRLTVAPNSTSPVEESTRKYGPVRLRSTFRRCRISDDDDAGNDVDGVVA